MIAKSMTVEEIKQIVKDKKLAVIKYVRVGEDFRYAIPGGPVEHRQLVEESEIPTSAGFFSLFEDSLLLNKTPSTTLKLGPLPEDLDLLKTIFGV